MNLFDIFLKGALFKIKENNSALELKPNFLENTNFIESIEILHLKTIDDYDLITSKIRELLAS